MAAISVARAEREAKVLYLYVVMDLFSRLVVGWMLADKETGDLAVRLLEKCYQRHKVKPGQLTVHAPVKLRFT